MKSRRWNVSGGEERLKLKTAGDRMDVHNVCRSTGCLGSSPTPLHSETPHSADLPCTYSLIAHWLLRLILVDAQSIPKRVLCPTILFILRSLFDSPHFSLYPNLWSALSLPLSLPLSFPYNYPLGYHFMITRTFQNALILPLEHNIKNLSFGDIVWIYFG